MKEIKNEQKTKSKEIQIFKQKRKKKEYSTKVKGIKEMTQKNEISRN